MRSSVVGPYRRCVVGPELQRSGRCLGGTHELCPHFSAVEVGSLWRRGGGSEHVLTLCVCDCHAACPLAGQGAVVHDVWRQQCACPGAERVRERVERSADRRREVADVVAEARREGGLTSDQIETRLRAVFLRRGEPPPLRLASWAEVTAAATGRPGTRTPRLVWMGVRAVAGTVRWAFQPGNGAEAHNRAETRSVYRSVGVVALAAVLLTAVARRTSGWRRLASTVAATIAWLTALWAVTIGTVVARIARSAEANTRPGPRR
jgi:hypothetical protein